MSIMLNGGIDAIGAKKQRSTSSTAAKTLGRLFNKKAKSSSCGSNLRQLAQYEQGIHLSIPDLIQRKLSSFLDVVNVPSPHYIIFFFLVYKKQYYSYYIIL